MAARHPMRVRQRMYDRMVRKVAPNRYRFAMVPAPSAPSRRTSMVRPRSSSRARHFASCVPVALILWARRRRCRLTSARSRSCCRACAIGKTKRPNYFASDIARDLAAAGRPVSVGAIIAAAVALGFDIIARGRWRLQRRQPVAHISQSTSIKARAMSVIARSSSCRSLRNLDHVSISANSDNYCVRLGASVLTGWRR